jgi:hypothetical protein
VNGAVPAAFDNPLQLSFGQPMVVPPYVNPAAQPAAGADGLVQGAEAPAVPLQNGMMGFAPAAVPQNGQLADDTSFRERIAMMNLQSGGNSLVSPDVANLSSSGRLSPSTRLRLISRQPQSVAIAPLDLAFSGEGMGGKGVDAALLSPVYENRTPSPTVIRNGEIFSKADVRRAEEEAKGTRADHTKPEDGQKNAHSSHKPSPLTQQTSAPRENGHVRGARSETDGAWQKAGKGRKKANIGPQTNHAEPAPKNTSERKGG